MADAEINQADSDSDQPSQAGSNYIPAFMYAHYNVREGLAKYITSTGQLYTSAEHVRFERFIKAYVQPEYVTLPLYMIRRDCFKFFNEKKRNLISEFSSFNGTMSFTLSFWSSGENGFGFVCVAAHYIDSTWMLQKRIIAFRMLEYPHNDNVIFQCMVDILREYSIDDKVFNITFDNVICNDAIIDMFKDTLQHPHGGQFSHMRCFSHMINSIALEGLTLMETHIERIRGAIVYIASSADRQQEFSTLCVSRGLKSRKFKPDMKTHWNSTYLMLNSCVNYNAAISDFYNGKHESSLLCETDWELCFVFKDFLRRFYEVATLLGSRVYCPSSCVGLDYLSCIIDTFSEHRGHLGFKAIFDIMESKFISYCESALPSFCLAAAMDPRYKLSVVEEVVNEISQCISMPLKMDAKALETLLHDLYKVYESKFAKPAEPIPSDRKRYRFDSYQELREIKRQKDIQKYGPTELHKYLGIDYASYMTDQEYAKLDILDWWKSNKGAYPVLSNMARDLLTPSVSAIAPEFVFSTAGKQILDYRRSMRSPKKLECNFCMKDWEDAQHRAQNWTDDMVEYFADSDESNVDDEMKA